MKPEEMKDTFPFREVSCIASYPHVNDCPSDKPAVVFCGPSNSGKSSLLSAICDHKNLARVSKTAGKTQLINYFIVPETSGQREAYFVDLPGYGFAKLPQKKIMELRQMIDSFLMEAPSVVLTVLVLDCRRKISDTEISIIDFHRTTDRPLLIARTKWDKLNTQERSKAKSQWKKEEILSFCVPVSSTKRTGIPVLNQKIRSYLTGSPPLSSRQSPL